MVEYFILKNFLSYRDKVELSFVASKKDISQTDQLPPHWYKDIDNKRLLKLLIGVGFNGTGKTKMLKGLSYLCKLATSRPETPNERPDYYPFLLDDESRNEPTEMWLSYYINNDNYLYYIKVSRFRIEEEELKLLDGKGQRVYYRSYDSNTDTVHVSFGIACDLTKNDQRDLSINTVNNSSVMSVFGSLNLESKILRTNYDYLHNRISFVHRSDQNLADKLNTGNKKHDARMKSLLLQLLHDIGTNIVDYHIDMSSINIDDLIKNGAPDFMVDALKRQYPSGVIENKVLRFEHSTTHGSRSIDSSLESFGTLNIIRLLVVLYDVVLGKKCTSIDELGAGVHSLALEFIIKMYLMLSDESQVIVATHDLSLLNSKFLRRDAVRVFDKNSDGITTVSRHKYVHNTINFYKRYTSEIRKDFDKVMDDLDNFKSYQDVIDKDD